MSRKKARVAQMQVLFQMDLNNEYSLDSLNIFLENNELENDENEYLKTTIPVILENLEEIDKIISQHLEGWSFRRLAKTDKAIIRIAVYEFLFREDIPKEVAINEAISIAKNFGNSDSYKFINGVLGSIYRNKFNV